MASYIQDASGTMTKTVATFKNVLAGIRTGRANPSLLDPIRVDLHGIVTPLTHVATVTAVDARTLQVKPWDRMLIGAIDKAIRASDLGLNPSPQGDCVRVPLPALTAETRAQFVKSVKAEAEKSRIAIRQIRRNVNEAVKRAVKDDQVTTNEKARVLDRVQKMTDTHTAEIDQLAAEKEKELMSV